MEHEILVPLDGSPAAEAALPQALLMARATGSVLHLLRVIPDVSTPMAFWPGAMAIESRVDQVEVHAVARSYLDHIASALRALHYSVRITILTGDPATRIIEWASENPA